MSAELMCADWFCPVCGGRLSYGVYCKLCKAEVDWSWRPADASEIEAAALSATIREIRQRQREELVSAYESLGWGLPDVH